MVTKEEGKMGKDEDLIIEEIIEINAEAENIRREMGKLNKKIEKLKKKSSSIFTAYSYTIHIPKLINNVGV